MLFGTGKHYIYINPKGEYLSYFQGHVDRVVITNHWTEEIGRAIVFRQPLSEGYEKALAEKVQGELVRREIELHIVGDVKTITA